LIFDNFCCCAAAAVETLILSFGFTKFAIMILSELFILMLFGVLSLSNAFPCNVGFCFNTTLNACKSCPVDNYCPSLNVSCSLVSPCPIGSYTEDEGSTSEVDCVYPSQVDSDYCEISSQIFFNSTYSSKFKISDYYLSKSRCFPCPLSSVRINNNTYCTCLPGTYLNERGRCSECPSGYSTNLDSVFYDSQNYGLLMFPFLNASTCSACPEGTISIEKVVSESNNVSICEPCPAGQYSNVSKNTCYDCPAGYYSTVRSSSCYKCPATSGTSCPSHVDIALCNSSFFFYDSFGSSSEYYLFNNNCYPCPSNSVRMNDDEYCSCVPGTYLNESGHCIYCPSGYSTSVESIDYLYYDNYNYNGVEQFGCEPVITSVFQNNTVCTACPEGTVSRRYSHGSFAYSSYGYQMAICVPCTPGEYRNVTANSCVPCPRNFYNPAWGSACSKCQSGRTTVWTGSYTADQCFSPLPNFVLGLLCLFVVFLIFVRYIVFGKFYRLSFERKIQMMLPNVERCKQLIHYQTIERKELLKVEKKHDHVTRLKLLTFVVIALSGFFVAILVGYVILLYSVFFSSIIIWRGLRLYYDLTPILEALKKMLSDISTYLPFQNLFDALLSPFFAMFDALANLHFDISSVNVTCAGSQAPLELFINCLVFGLLVIFIRSDYQILTNLLLSNVNRNYMFNSIEKHLGKGNLWFGKYFYFCFLISVIILTNPFQLLLRYSMGFIFVSSFSKSREVFHESSGYCDRFDSLDTGIAITSSVFAWYLILPCVYSLAEVVTPKIININSQFLINPRSEMKRKAVQMLSLIQVQGLFPKLNSNKVHHFEDQQSDKEGDISDSVPMNDFDDDLSQRVPKFPVSDEVLLSEFDKTFPNEKFRFRNKKEKLGFIKKFYLESSRKMKTVYIVGGDHDQTLSKQNSGLTYQFSCVRSFCALLKRICVQFLSLDMWFMYFLSKWLRYLHHSIVNSASETDFKNSVIDCKEEKISISQKMKTGKTMWKEYLSRFDYENEKQRSSLDKLWEEECCYGTNSLPSYYDLCIMERDEFHQRLMEPFASIFAMFGIGHFFTKVGRYHWSIVLNSYKIFLFACLGIWTDDTVQAYDIKGIVRDMLYSMDTGMDGEDELFFRARYELDEEVPNLLSIIINSRAILFQLFPYLTVFTAISMRISAFPLFIRSSYLQLCMPSLLIIGEENRNLSIEKELYFLGFLVETEEEEKIKLKSVLDKYNWRIYVRGVIIFWNNSRLLMFVNSLVLTILALLFVFYDHSYLRLIVILLGLLLPYVVAVALIVFLFVGKSMDITDMDLYEAFGYNPFTIQDQAINGKTIESYVNYSKNKILKLKEILSDLSNRDEAMKDETGDNHDRKNSEKEDDDLGEEVEEEEGFIKVACSERINSSNNGQSEV
jgi:hypothetical protein